MSARIPILVALLLLAAPLHAEESQARSYFSIGQGHYALGEFAAAIEAFQAGYRYKPLPLFLFNIAQAARKSGRYDMAEDYYVLYLERETVRTAPQRIEAEQWAVKLRKEADQMRARHPSGASSSSSSASTKDPTATRSTPPPPPVTVAPPPAVATVPAAQPSLTPVPELVAPEPAIDRAAAKPARPIWKRAWFWGTIGAVAVVGVGVGVGTWLALQPRGPAKPNLGSVDF